MADDVHNATPECDGSAPLPDRRREAFARALFEGVEVCTAYTIAGFKRPRGNAHRMEREAGIQAQINFLRRELDEADLKLRAVRRQQLRHQFMQIARIDRLGMFEEIEITKKIGRGRNAREITLRRLQLKPLAVLTPEQRALVEGLESGGLRVVMPSKIAALSGLAKLDGLDAPAKVAATDAEGRDVPISDADRIRALAAIIARVQAEIAAEDAAAATEAAAPSPAPSAEG
jgi:hypothetical protein